MQDVTVETNGPQDAHAKRDRVESVTGKNVSIRDSSASRANLRILKGDENDLGAIRRDGIRIVAHNP